ncbi:YggS family pyridoxal phosphate-dependent enzyme [Tepidanaerobacter syntrophicus]|uniref:YggS family pyridoxal phosphate-dependent enzyme n=1 Tax=Tepidanaerobacter syntrophicus TaxID=224999 RepID=UPI001BD3E958|nr:YggS family pyridoxal phosphate-dependent enzyme [Tepidanaerobacter syntrophicus]
MSVIKENIKNIESRIKTAAEKSGRNFKDISLVAVTKTISPEIIQEAVDAGITLLGENKVQEARDKIDKIKGDVEWHLIGHLQRNKVKIALELFSLIQSLDSFALAEEIQKRARQMQKNVDVLVQINIGLEKTKYGINPADAESFIESVASLENLNVKGLMAIAPFKENPEDVRPYFREMRSIFERIKQKSIKNVEMKYLSMGMSNDFEVAIEEGSNMVRIGTAIFGARDYSK